MKTGLSIPMALLALSVMVLWGFSFVAIEIALREVTPWQLVILRFMPALLVFAGMLAGYAVSGKLKLRWRDLPVLLFAGLFGVAVYNLSLNTGQTRLPASLAALVIALNPAMITITATIWLGERPKPRTWFGLVLALVGIVFVVVARHGTPEIRANHLLGILITLGAPVSWGIFTSSMRYSAPKIGATVATITAITVGSLPLTLGIGPELVSTVGVLSPAAIWSILFLSLGCTVYGFTMWAYVLKHVEASTAGMFIYFVPLIAAAGSYLLLDEPLDLALFGGGTITILGVAISTGLIHHVKHKFARAK